MDCAPREELFKLREHVTHMEYRVGDALPPLDDVLGGSGGESRSRKSFVVDSGLVGQAISASSFRQSRGYCEYLFSYTYIR